MEWRKNGDFNHYRTHSRKHIILQDDYTQSNLLPLVFWTIICIWSFSASEHGSLGLLIVIAFFCAAGGWAMLIMTNGSVDQMEKDIQTASRSVEEYQKVLDARMAYAQMQSEKLKAEEALKHPNCPNCGSTNTQIISTLNRAVSIGTVGLASSKIGKQYECKKCKHKW